MEGFCQLYLPKLNGRKVLGREKQNMYRKDSEGWLKHGDFIVLDMICLQLAFILAYDIFFKHYLKILFFLYGV